MVVMPGRGDWAWIGILAGITAYELHAIYRDGELLSEAADRHRDRHPILVHAAVAYLAAHLTRRIPARVDPLHRLTVRLRR